MEKDELELSERQITILDAVIRNYLATGEPVGSRTISKYTDLNLSSATIRNEMSDLEEMGYIVQPHTSAGRIPSDKGYRLYVDHLIEQNEKKDKEISDMKEFVIEKTEKMDKILKQAAKMLATNTNYATLVSAPDVNHNKVKFIQLSQVDDQHLLAVIVMNNNMVRNKMVNLYEALDNETILKLNILLNTSLNGLAMNEINLGTIARLKEQAGIHSGIVSDVLDALVQTFAESEDLKIYTSGATNILKYPELSDSDSAATLLSAFEEKEELVSLVTESLSDSEKTDNGTGIQVYIGNESPIQTMKDCSVVTATYDLGEGVKGTIGIVGPKRMDYEKVMDNLKTLKSQLDGIYNKSDEET
nr:heat-inducible transcriptional repressor HrcA [uncultured Agathobacter sp.]